MGAWVMALSAALAACIAAMCAFCRRSPLLAGKRRCILTYMWPSYHEVFAAGHYRLMAYREQYIPHSAGECRRVLAANPSPYKQMSPCRPQLASPAPSRQWGLLQTGKPHLISARLHSWWHQASFPDAGPLPGIRDCSAAVQAVQQCCAIGMVHC